MRWAAIAFGVVIAFIGIVGLVDPALLLDATRFTLTSLGLYIVAAIRIAFGLVLIGAATTSRMPRTLRILGAFIVLAGIITPFFGVERTRTIVEWWSAQSTAFMRTWVSLAVIFGLFIIYVVTPRRRDT
jgi:uncharacterized membrane protein YoaT (DUF817 family)